MNPEFLHNPIKPRIDQKETKNSNLVYSAYRFLESYNESQVLPLESPENELGLNSSPEYINSEAVDRIWFNKLKTSSGNEPYEYFLSSKERTNQEKERFFNGETRNPYFNYPKIDVYDLIEKENFLKNLRQEILAYENIPAVRESYKWKINEEITKGRLLMSSAVGDMEMFKEYSERLYGKPSTDLFNFNITRLHTKLDKSIKHSGNSDLIEAAAELKNVLPKINLVSNLISLPTRNELEYASLITQADLGDIINISDKKDLYKSTDIQQEFKNAIQKLHVDGWNVEIDSKTGRSNISVSTNNKRVVIPENRELLHNQLQKLIAHEIGTHVVRSNNGEKSRLMLLGIGLDKYDKGEEGIATMREQTVDGEMNKFKREDGHLAISLAYGLDGLKRDFRDVFEIMKKYYKYILIKGGETKETSENISEELAWNRTFRTFRGTDFNTPGVCFTKDIVYNEGNVDIWNVVKNNPEELMRFNVGKYDPANPRHIWVLEQLGIKDVEIQNNRY